MTNKNYFRQHAIDIINRPIDYTCDNIIDVARLYKALEYLQKRAVREDNRNLLVKALQYEQKYSGYTAEDIKEILGRQWKQQIVNLKQFADAIKWRFEHDYVCPIGTYEDDLVREFGHKNICNYIKKSREIGLFNRLTEYYDIDNNISYQYSFNDSIYNLIKDINQIIDSIKSDTNNIHTETIKNNHIGEKVVFDDSRLRVGSDLSGIDVTDIPDEVIIDALNRKYRQAKDYMNVADEINSSLPDEEKIIFRWNVVRSTRKNDMLKKVGIRACSRMCNYKKMSRAYDSVTYKGKYREDYLDNRFGTGKWTEFDFKSSIWQLTYFFNKGKWLNNSTDLYNEIYKKVIDKSGFRNRKERALFKLFGNVEYFDNPNMMAIHTLSKIYNIRNWLKEYYGLSKDEINGYYDFKTKSGDKKIYDSELQTTKMIFSDVSKAIEDVIGQLYGSEIFLHESCLYLELFRQLRDSGLDVVQVFDGFYFSKDIEDEVSRFIETRFVDILDNYKIKYSDSINLNRNIDKKQSSDKTNKNISYRGKSRFSDNSDIIEAIQKDEQLLQISEQIYDCIKKAYKNALIGASTAKSLTEALDYRFDTACFKKTWTCNDTKTVSGITELINNLKRKR